MGPQGDLQRPDHRARWVSIGDWKTFEAQSYLTRASNNVTMQHDAPIVAQVFLPPREI